MDCDGGHGMRDLSERFFGGTVFGLVAAALFTCSASAAQSITPIPELSGNWARQAFEFEQPGSGPGPIVNLTRNSEHPAHLNPSWSGDSVGHYEGDTLVIDTVGVKVGPFSMVDIFGTPHSEAVHLVERYRLIDYKAAKQATEKAIREQGYGGANEIDEGVMFDARYRGKGLQVQFTVDDPNVFTTPWSAAVTYRRAADDWVEYVCPENTREYYANRNTDIPTADKPDF
jgi:hypothetical protein